MKNPITKAMGCGALAAILLAATQPAYAVSYADIMILRGENQRLQGKIDRLQDEMDVLKRRAMRLTSECGDQGCVLKEAVTYGSYGECKQSIAPEKADTSVCMPLYDADPSGGVPSSP
jgi:hypothetical protein